MTPKPTDAQVAGAFNSNRVYFQMMRDWHQQHNGAALEPEVEAFIHQRCLPGRCVMEAGCGEGSITHQFAQQHPQTAFVGVDISQIGVEMAQGFGLSNAAFHVADLKCLPFDDGYFDFVFAQSVLEHVVGWDQSIREFCRVLRSGGELLIRVGNGGRHGRSMLAALIAYMFKRNSVIPQQPTFELRSGDRGAHMTNFDVPEIPSDILLRELRAVGFTIAYFSTRTHTWRTRNLSWKTPFAWGVSMLNFWPFNHLGLITIVLARKPGYH